jgi:hypothetical protein
MEPIIFLSDSVNNATLIMRHSKYVAHAIILGVFCVVVTSGLVRFNEATGSPFVTLGGRGCMVLFARPDQTGPPFKF